MTEDILYSDEERKESYLDHGDSADLEKDEQNRIAERNDELNQLRHFLRTRAGRNVFNRILRHSGVFKMSMMPSDTHLTAFHEGQRDVGMWLFNELQSVAVTTAEDEEAFNEMVTDYWRSENE